MAPLDKKLQEVEWGEYRIGDLFEISRGNISKQKELISDKNGIVFIAQNNCENGFVDIVKPENHKQFKGNSLVVGRQTGVVYYQEKDFITTDGVLVLISKNDFIKNRNTGLIVASALTKKMSSFGYNNTVSASKLNEITIQLPTKNGEIDFAFMESFIAELEAERIAELEAERIAELEAYLLATGLKDYTLTEEEEQALADFESGKFEWGEFRIGELFDVATGRDVIIGKVLNGNIPLISHQHENNGITKNISQLENRRLFNFEDTLSLADRGVFLATTQNENFHIGTRVKALTFKEGKKDLKSRLFFVASINRLQVLFTEYASNATGNLPNLNIALPTQNTAPNYTLMETFISAIQKLVIKDVVQYAERKIAATREVVEKEKV